MRSEDYTGRSRHRIGFLGRFILQVEKYGADGLPVWVDATHGDLYRAHWVSENRERMRRIREATERLRMSRIEPLVRWVRE